MNTLLSTDETTSLIQKSQLRHVAFIMDGNRRWAKKRKLPTLFGHSKGVESLRAMVHHAGVVGLEYMTVYAFSSENWQRSQEEVGYLMKLAYEVLEGELNTLHAANVRLRFVGDIAAFPEHLRSLIERSMEKTAGNQGLNFQLAINYGSRQELVHVMRELARQVQDNQLRPEQIDEQLVNQHLYTQGIPDPDLIIRTGGDYRLSNYLLWQSAYAELFVTETLWPEFSPEEFNRAVQEFAARERRYGK